MRKNIIIFALGAMLVAVPGRVAAEPALELPAGTVLEDGLVAGEWQALEYLQAHAPGVYKRLAAMDPQRMRSLYADEFVWFQRVGAYRTRQKCDAIRKLQNDFGIPKKSKAKCIAEIRSTHGKPYNPSRPVPGEKQALEYFREHTPDIYERLVKMEPARMRKIYGKYFIWFQRVGNYRKRQKRMMIQQIRYEFGIHDLSEDYGRASSSVQRAHIREEIRGTLKKLFDSGIGLMEYQVKGMAEELRLLEGAVAAHKRKIKARSKAGRRLIGERLEELIGEG